MSLVGERGEHVRSLIIEDQPGRFIFVAGEAAQEANESKVVGIRGEAGWNFL